MLKSLVKEIVTQSAAQSTGSPPSTDLLQKTWATLVGDELARCTLPVAWNNGELELEVSSARWLDEFSRQRSRLRSKLAGLLPWQLSDIHLKIASPSSAQHFAALLSDSSKQSTDARRSSQPAPNSHEIAAQMNLSDKILADLEPLDEDTRVNLLRIRQHITRRENNSPK